MTPHHHHNPLPRSWRLQLLAYVDGELPEADRHRVEARLENDPEAKQLLLELEALCPAQRELWRSVGPRTPSSGTWERVRANLSDILPKQKSTPSHPVRRGRRWMVPLALLSLAASVFLAFAVLPGAKPRPHAVNTQAAETPPPMREDPLTLLAEYDVLPVAAPADVMVSRVRGNQTAILVSCDHPIPGAIALAAADDVEISPLDTGTPDWILTLPEPGDAPVLMGVQGKK